MIPNPEYKPDEKLFQRCNGCTHIGFELWQVRTALLRDERLHNPCKALGPNPSVFLPIFFGMQEGESRDQTVTAYRASMFSDVDAFQTFLGSVKSRRFGKVELEIPRSQILKSPKNLRKLASEGPARCNGFLFFPLFFSIMRVTFLYMTISSRGR